MRKSILFSLLVLTSASFLSSCGFSSQKAPSLEERIGEEKVVLLSYEGELKSLDSLDVYQSGTHLLETKDEGVIYMQSPLIDLGRYEGEMVLVSGNLDEGIGSSKPVLVVERVIYVDEEKNKSEKIYKNDSFGLEFPYPVNWEFTEEVNLISFQSNGSPVLDVTIFSSVEDFSSLVALEEDLPSTAVTIAAQPALRITDDQYLVFYVSHPSKQKVYRFEYYFQEDQDLQSEFYDVLDGVELIYTRKIQGELCGGLQRLDCPENYICQLSSGDKYAEGVCQPIGGQIESNECPYIAPPTECEVYQVSEYGSNGCPVRYSCELDVPISDRDLNTVDAGDKPDGLVLEEDESLKDASVSGEASQEEILIEASESDEDIELENVDVFDLEYLVPEAADLTFEYKNERIGFGLLMPKTWYYQNFGYVDGDYIVGFSSQEMDGLNEALIRLAVDVDDELGFTFSSEKDLESISAEMKKGIFLIETDAV